MNGLFYSNTKCVFGSKALATSISASLAVCRVLSTTLGPRAMSKMLVDDETGRVLVTSDGGTILRYLKISHPAASLLIDLALSQERAVCDGTKTTVILTGEILSMASQLIYPHTSSERGMHPMVVVQSLASVVEDIVDILNSDQDGIAIKVEKGTQIQTQNIEGGKGLDFLQTLYDVALMSLSTKLPQKFANKIASISVDTVMSVACNTLNYKEITELKDFKIDGSKIVDIDHRIKIVSLPGGDIEQSCLIRGLVLQCEVLTDFATSTAQKICVVSFEVSESVWMKSELSNVMNYEDWVVWFISGLVRMGVTAFFTTKTVEDFALQHFTLNKIFVGQKVTHLDSIKLARSMKIIVAADPEHIVDWSAGNESEANQEKASSLRIVGHSKEIVVNDSFVFIYLDGSESETALFITVLLYGSTIDAIQEIQRSLFGALGSLRTLLLEKYTFSFNRNFQQSQEDGFVPPPIQDIDSYKVVLGGGCTEIALSLKLRKMAEKMVTESSDSNNNNDKYKNIKDKHIHYLITNKFADCLECVPLCLAKNANVHPHKTMKRVQDAHKRGDSRVGLDGTLGTETDTYENKMFEPLSIKIHSILTAVEIVCAILRIDTIIQTISE